VLDEARRVLRDDAPDQRDEPERGEGEHRPERRSVAPAEPEPDRDDPDREERDEVDVLERAGKVAQKTPNECDCAATLGARGVRCDPDSGSNGRRSRRRTLTSSLVASTIRSPMTSPLATTIAPYTAPVTDTSCLLVITVLPILPL